MEAQPRVARLRSEAFPCGRAGIPHRPTLGATMKRRRVWSMLGGLTLGVALPGRAQVPKTARVGVISSFEPSPSRPTAVRSWAAFRAELRSLGWSEGQNLVIEPRFSQGRPERDAPLAAERLAQGSRVRRPDPARSEAGGTPGAAANPVQLLHQPQDRERDRSHDPGRPAAGGRADRLTRRLRLTAPHRTGSNARVVCRRPASRGPVSASRPRQRAYPPSPRARDRRSRGRPAGSRSRGRRPRCRKRARSRCRGRAPR